LNGIFSFFILIILLLMYMKCYLQYSFYSMFFKIKELLHSIMFKFYWIVQVILLLAVITMIILSNFVSFLFQSFHLLTLFHYQSFSILYRMSSHSYLLHSLEKISSHPFSMSNYSSFLGFIAYKAFLESLLSHLYYLLNLELLQTMELV
jgi:hypothetical protein